MDRRCRCYGRLEIRRDADRFVWSQVVIVERLGIGSLGLAAHWGLLGCAVMTATGSVALRSRSGHG